MSVSKKSFYVVAVISNPIGYRSRYELYRKFKHEMEAFGVQLFTVEMAFGDRPFEVTHHSNPMNLQVRSWDELWHKENLINLGIARLPSDWEYVAWVDADITFVNKHWVSETIRQLQHYMVVQLFQTAVDLGPSKECIQVHTGFGYMHSHCIPWGPVGYGHRKFAHPGFAWAARREAIDKLGGLIDRAILGAADHHMALAMVGRAKESMPAGLHPNYRKMILNWEKNAIATLRLDIGYVPGTILHHWHGKKANRKYIERWGILTHYKFDPDKDLKRDWQGLYQLMTHKIKMRDALRRYFRERFEDGNEL